MEGSVITYLANGFVVFFTPEHVIAAIIGAVLGLIVGAMPGIGSLAGCALLLPLTYAFDPTTAIIMLGAVYYSNMYGGSFSAILLNIPGDSPAICTALDGYPMATKRHRPGQALFTANMASFIGGTIGILILTMLGPALARVGLAFGPSEMTVLLLIAMTSITWLVGENPIKGVVITIVGILLACIGMDTLSGVPRYDFDNLHLLGGLPFTAFIIGAIGFAQVIEIANDRHKTQTVDPSMKLSIRGSLLTKHDLKRLIPPSLRSGALGTFVGVLPGAGATTGAFLGYSLNKHFKSEDAFGTGAVEGIAASEAANNAAAAGAFAPLLALGIPGSGTGAVLLGGLMMWGLNPGPLLFVNEPDFTWGLIASLFFSNIFALVVAVSVIPFLIKILTVPIRFLIPVVITICVVGAYSSSFSMYGVLVMLISGIVCYFLAKAGYPTAPMILSFVLASLLESNMRKAFIVSGGSLDIFVQRPISCALTIVFLIFVGTPIIRALIRRFRKKPEAV